MKDLTKPLVKKILENPSGFDWTLQGLGMLRTYIGSNDLRLHVWDSRFAFPDVSTMHTHPWNFHSLIVAGEVRQVRFVNPEVIGGTPPSKVFKQQEILCGVGGGPVEGQGPKIVHFSSLSEEVYREGDVYSQLAHEIHSSYPVDGTVTIIEREMLDDTEHAFVYWDVDKEWVTAEPRPATTQEIAVICQNALKSWFTE
jgi:hypothetical protein